MKSFDIIHLHFANFLVLWICLLTGKQIVLTQHSLIKSRRKLDRSEKINYFLISYLFPHKRITVTTVSEFSQSKLQKEYRWLSGLIVLYNFIPEAGKRTIKGKRVQQLISLVSYGRLVPNKRLDLFLEILSRLIQNNVNVRGTILGEGPEWEPLVLKIKDSGMEQHMKLSGFKENTEDYLRSADFCVFPFRDETFGLSTLEAMSYGVPAFALKDGGGITEILNPVQNGYLICKSTDEIADKIMYLIDRPAEYAKLSELCFERSHMFSEKQIIPKYLELYKRLTS